MRARLSWPTLLMVLVAPAAISRADEPTGAQIYKQLCGRCHGAEGEGTKKEYDKPLAGSWPLERLTRYIAAEMPADDPGKLTPAQTRQVAAFVFDAFYSEAAQARLRPARVELARLTVRQYRNALADLIAGLRPAAPASSVSGSGLKGEYFKGKVRGFKAGAGAPVFTRLDPVIRVDLGSTSPDARKLESDEFSVRWEGALLAPETGEYEFLIRTDQSGRLWLNDVKVPLIDASVKSGSDTEYKGTIYLLGGRHYPVRLEFFRSTLGVQKKDKAKPLPVQASFALEWKRPQRAFELIAERHLFPVSAAPVLVVRTPFPPDDRSAGYERGSAVSKAWVDATTEGAIEVASYISSNLAELAGAPADAPRRKEALRDFALRLAERAFRRPLSAEERKLYVERQFETAPDEETAVKRTTLFVLKSPWFLYREPESSTKAGAGYFAAARTSFGLWDSLPDTELIKSAAAGKLSSRAEIAAQAERMLNDPRARAKIRDFFLQWLKVETAGDLAKDTKRFPGFDLAAAADLRTSLELFLDEAIWSEASDFRQLLLAEHIYLNGRLARFYGAKLPADAPFQKVAFHPDQRCGVLTHPYLMATFSYPRDSSPIHRGVFLARSVLGLPLRPPPDAFTPLPAELHPDLSTRERVALQTKPLACQSCHAVINPLGFILERYDAIGRFRARDKGKEIDTSGTYETRAGKMMTFTGVRELAAFLTKSDEVHEAFVAQLFHHLVKQPIRAYGHDKLTELHRFFGDNDCNIRKLAVEIIAQTALGPPPPNRAASAGKGAGE